MVNSITFENFRGLKKLELPELSQITLLTGRNNAGKSSVLEGIYLVCAHTSMGSLSLINLFRSLQINAPVDMLWGAMFHNQDTANPICFSIKADGKSGHLEYMRDDSALYDDQMVIGQNSFARPFFLNRPYGLKFHFEWGTYREDGRFLRAFNSNNTTLEPIKTNLPKNQIRLISGVYHIGASYAGSDSVINEWCGQLELSGRKRTVVDILQSIDPLINDFSVIVQQGQPYLYAKIGESSLPFKTLGDGTNRLLYIILTIIENPNSVILIDEIESGFHYSMQEKLWNTIAKAAKESNCQIIAATHSYECIQNAVDGVAEAGMEDRFCLYRLEHKGEENRAFRLSGDLVHYSIDANMEVR